MDAELVPRKPIMREVVMRVTVKKWGNSAAIRIPAPVLKAAKVEIDDAVDVREENGRIVVEPLRSSSYDLADLIGRITPDNLHGEIDFGPRAARRGCDGDPLHARCPASAQSSGLNTRS